MKIHALVHARHEGLGVIREWIDERGHSVEETRLWAGDALPAADAAELWVVMGGPMNVDEEARYPWLRNEKGLIAEAIASGKRVLGICLGSQLIARALGAAVAPTGEKEIGWFPVRAERDRHPLFPELALGQETTVAHWHGDAFRLPAGCERLFSSRACGEQGFAYPAGGSARVLALQFHLELGEAEASAFAREGRTELAEGGPWVQDAGTYVAGARSYGGHTKRLLFRALDVLAG